MLSILCRRERTYCLLRASIPGSVLLSYFYLNNLEPKNPKIFILMNIHILHSSWLLHTPIDLRNRPSFCWVYTLAASDHCDGSPLRNQRVTPSSLLRESKVPCQCWKGTRGFGVPWENVAAKWRKWEWVSSTYKLLCTHINL